MKKKAIILFLIGLFIVSLLPAVEAAREDESAFGNAFGFISDILNTQVKLPHVGPVLSRLRDKDKTVPLGVVGGAFVMIYSLMWVVAGRIPLFQGEGIRNARIAFAVGFTVITILVSPIIEMTADMVGTLGSFGAVALFVIGIVAIAGLFALSGKAFNWGRGKTPAEKKEEGELEAEEGEVVGEEKFNAAEKRTLSKLEGVTKAEIHDTDKVISNLKVIKDILGKRMLDIRRPTGRNIVMERLEKIKNIEKELEDRFPFVQALERKLMGFLRVEFQFDNDEKLRVEKTLGIPAQGSRTIEQERAAAYLWQANKLNNYLINQLKIEIKEFQGGISNAFESIKEKERGFIQKYNMLLVDLQKSVTKLISFEMVKFLDDMIKIKEEQKPLFKIMFRAEKVMEYLENKEIVEGIEEIRDLKRAGRAIVAPPVRGTTP